VYTLRTSRQRRFLPQSLLAAAVSVGNADVADLGTDCAACMVEP
jgi:hypothetical protein